MSSPVRSADSPCALCAAPIPRGGGASAEIEGVVQTYCCHGCAAIADMAAAMRASAACTPAPPALDALPDTASYLRFDDVVLQRNLVFLRDAHSAEAGLAVHGVHCASCSTVIETALGKLDGMLGVAVDVTQQKARVRWDPTRIPLSRILAALARVGYPAAPERSAQAAAARTQEARSALKRLGIAALGMMQVMMFAVPAYVTQDGVAPEQEQLLRWASLVLTLPVLLYSAWPFFYGAVRDLMARRLGMDVPAALGLTIAFAASAWQTFAGDGPTYYDSITMFVLFVLAGRYFELRARHGALSAAEALTRAQSPFCTRLAGYPQQRTAQTVPLATLLAGDCVRVNPGEGFPADGRVVEGKSSASEALLTGEAAPVAKQPGSVVFAGTLNLDAPLTVSVEAAGEATRLASIVRQLDVALAAKPRIALVADRFAGGFVGALLALAVLTAIVWFVLEPARALPVTVAVLVVSCPCALSLAMPAALSAAMAALARRGVLVFRGQALEAFARVTHVVFDKTGTLTTGEPSLARIVTRSETSAERCLALAAALEQGSQHPLAQALKRAARDQSCAPANRTTAEQVVGQGVAGVIDGKRYRLGQLEFVAGLHGKPMDEFELADDATSIVALGDERGWLALFSLRDTLREEARTLVCTLRERGLAVSLYSGDRAEAVSHCARSLGIRDARGGMTPEAKREAIAVLQAQGAVVIMIGDGANDSPALAQAQASMALATGAAIAHSGADVVLVGTDLRPAALALDTARRTLRVVRQNFVWAAAYNAFAVPLAMAGLLTPWLAGLGMSLSSFLVVANALRLTRAPRETPAYTAEIRWKFS